MSEKKTPQDHLQPKDKPKHVEVRGIQLDIDPKLFDDLEIVELVAAVNDGTPQGSLAIVPLIKRITGSRYQDVKETLRDPETGRVPLEAVSEFINELMKELAPNS
ncbi:hypothetical protein G1C98_1022 [Bifidobacterium sp. DSM 109960]|uniref:Phage protein n=1 Tax=Bifidobacterium erythrocebi TaxID=2675325 RepID=A0A7Y0HUL2_9BIFI|nr:MULTISPECIES: hypothetical protein [Bifidobacterium]MBW3095342.1 hypothetical protein [Bifidobacterium pongonis]NMM96286.1 hypothetical protein [Bifidobacterium sp. DSM 109960]